MQDASDLDKVAFDNCITATNFQLIVFDATLCIGTAE